ncbi:MAG: potassium channel family protein, partial [Terriglobales bacterium]
MLESLELSCPRDAGKKRRRNLRRRLLLAIAALLAITAAGVAGYRLLADKPVSLLDAFYMAIITLAGVGYGEIVDTSHNPALRVFNIF